MLKQFYIKLNYKYQGICLKWRLGANAFLDIGSFLFTTVFSPTRYFNIATTYLYCVIILFCYEKLLLFNFFATSISLTLCSRFDSYLSSCARVSIDIFRVELRFRQISFKLYSCFDRYLIQVPIIKFLRRLILPDLNDNIW